MGAASSIVRLSDLESPSSPRSRRPGARRAKAPRGASTAWAVAVGALLSVVGWAGCGSEFSSGGGAGGVGAAGAGVVGGAGGLGGAGATGTGVGLGGSGAGTTTGGGGPGGIGGGGGVGGQGECSAPTDCGGAATQCASPTCISHSCGIELASLGTICGEANEFCDGQGECRTCNQPILSDGGSCPSIVCNGGCNGNICYVQCSNAGACGAETISCPAGYACVVSCEGEASCVGVHVICPEGEQCTLNCVGNNSCVDAELDCSDTGPCHMSCSASTGACGGSALQRCGANSCAASCQNTSFYPTQLGCATACSCPLSGSCPHWQ